MPIDLILQSALHEVEVRMLRTFKKKPTKVVPFSARFTLETQKKLKFMARTYKVPLVNIVESLIWRAYDVEMERRVR